MVVYFRVELYKDVRRGHSRNTMRSHRPEIAWHVQKAISVPKSQYGIQQEGILKQQGTQLSKVLYEMLKRLDLG